MSLEAKAKTLAEISAERKKWQEAFKQGALGNQQAYAYARDNRPLYEQQTKWVPLEEALKLETERNELAYAAGVMCYDCEKCRVPQLEIEYSYEKAKRLAMTEAHNNRVKMHEELEAKIAEANKILEELVVPYHIFTSQDDWLVKLRKILSGEEVKKE